MKKSTFIDYNVIMAVLSHRKKKKISNVKQQPAFMEFSHSNAGLEKDALRKIAVYSKELVA
jgi:hypothetical protein